MSKVSKKTKKVSEVKNVESSNKERVIREDVMSKENKVDITKKPKNNDDCNRMDKRFFYVKTGNYVVYGRMLQLKRKEGYWLDENDQIRCKGDKLDK